MAMHIMVALMHNLLCVLANILVLVAMEICRSSHILRRRIGSANPPKYAMFMTWKINKPGSRTSPKVFVQEAKELSLALERVNGKGQTVPE